MFFFFVLGGIVLLKPCFRCFCVWWFAQTSKMIEATKCISKCKRGTGETYHCSKWRDRNYHAAMHSVEWMPTFYIFQKSFSHSSAILLLMAEILHRLPCCVWESSGFSPYHPLNFKVVFAWRVAQDFSHSETPMFHVLDHHNVKIEGVRGNKVLIQSGARFPPSTVPGFFPPQKQRHSGKQPLGAPCSQAKSWQQLPEFRQWKQ